MKRLSMMFAGLAILATVDVRAQQMHRARSATHEDEMTRFHRIKVDPKVSGGRPSSRGLRIRIKDALDMLAPGASHEQILADDPYLEAADIVAARHFAATQGDHSVLGGA
jgi:uncharacterized protein (DUF433 family)